MMTPDPGRERGPSAAWRALAVGWLDEQLASAGIERTGEVQQPHLRPWATVLTTPTTRGPVLLKVVGAASGHAGVVKMGEDAGAALVDAASLLGAL